MYKQSCVECAFSGACSADNLCECVECLAQYGEANDEMIDKYIGKRCEEFRREWVPYIGGGYE